MKKSLYFLILASCTSSLAATDIFVPALPAITMELHSSETLAQLSISLYLIFQCISQLVFGSISDKYGRRNAILSGWIIGLVGIFISMNAVSMESFLLGRCLQGIGLAAPFTLARAIVVDLSKGVELAKYNASLIMAYPIVLTGAPVLGGYLLVYFGWQSIFKFLFGYVCALFLLSLRYLPESNTNFNRHALHVKHLPGIYLNLFKNRRFMGYTLFAACGTSGMMAYVTESAFLLQNIGGLSAIQFSWISLALCIMITSSSIASRKLVEKTGYELLVYYSAWIILISGVCMYIGYLLFPAYIVLVVIVSTMVFILGNTFCSINTATAAMSDLKENLGLSNAMFQTVRMGCGGIASAIFALLIVTTPKPLAVCNMLVGIIGMIIIKVILAERHFVTKKLQS